MSASETFEGTHEKNVNRKPAVVTLYDKAGGLGATIDLVVDHVSPNEGMLLVIVDGETSYYPWHRVHTVTRTDGSEMVA